MEIDPNKAIDFIAKNAPQMGVALSNRNHLDDYSKVIKAELMNDEEGTLGNKEAYAYAHPRYKQHLLDLKEANRQYEELNWMMKAALARIEVFKAQEYTKRQELKNLDIQK